MSWSNEAELLEKQRVVKKVPTQPQYLYVHKMNGQVSLVESGGYIEGNKSDYLKLIGRIKLESIDD